MKYGQRRIPSRTLYTIRGRTSTSVELVFWEALADISSKLDLTVDQLTILLSQHQPSGQSLASVLKIYCLMFYRDGRLPFEINRKELKSLTMQIITSVKRDAMAKQKLRRQEVKLTHSPD